MVCRYMSLNFVLFTTTSVQFIVEFGDRWLLRLLNLPIFVQRNSAVHTSGYDLFASWLQCYIVGSSSYYFNVDDASLCNFAEKHHLVNLADHRFFRSFENA